MHQGAGEELVGVEGEAQEMEIGYSKET